MLDPPGGGALIIPFFRTPDDRRAEEEECVDATGTADWASGFCGAILIVPGWGLVELALNDVLRPEVDPRW